VGRRKKGQGFGCGTEPEQMKNRKAKKWKIGGKDHGPRGGDEATDSGRKAAKKPDY